MKYGKTIFRQMMGICSYLPFRLRRIALLFKLFCSYLFVAATPFLAFRKSTREAVLDLIRLDTSSGKKQGSRSKQSHNSSFIRLRKELLLLLIKLSVELKSSYIIRSENLIRIFYEVSEFDKAFAKATQETSAKDDYLYYLKKLLTLGSDEAKSLFLEFLLLHGYEYNQVKKSTIQIAGDIGMEFCISNSYAKEMPEHKDKLCDFIKTLYLENTKVLYNAARTFVKN